MFTYSLVVCAGCGGEQAGGSDHVRRDVVTDVGEGGEGRVRSGGAGGARQTQQEPRDAAPEGIPELFGDAQQKQTGSESRTQGQSQELLAHVTQPDQTISSLCWM